MEKKSSPVARVYFIQIKYLPLSAPVEQRLQPVIRFSSLEVPREGEQNRSFEKVNIHRIDTEVYF